MRFYLKDIQYHSFIISRLLCEQQILYFESSNWLEIASGIIDLKYISNRFDDTVQWCGTAMEYEGAKTQITEPYIKELTIFGYIWGGFESFLGNIFSSNEISRLGKINCATKILKTKFKDMSPIPYFKIITNKFVTMLSKSEFASYLTKAKVNNNISLNGIPLQLVYKIRNEFAHGGIEFPKHPDYGGNKTIKVTDIIKISSRLLLIYFQLLLLCLDYKFEVDASWYFNNFEEEEFIEVNQIISQLHLINFSIRKNIGLTLFSCT